MHKESVVNVESECVDENKKPSLINRDGLPKLVPGAGIEPARLAAGDFEFAFQGVCLG